MRLAIAHGQKLHTFCSITLAGKAIWNRDIDKSADANIVQTLSVKTSVSIKRARATTLADYEGILFEKHNNLGPAAWIMPIGIYHRTRRCFGMQYCSQCLSEDRTPYYRRRWRLAFMTICEKHHSLLFDRCQSCGAPVSFHRTELCNYQKLTAESLTLCHSCGSDLRDSCNGEIDGAHQPSSPITSKEVEFTRILLAAFDSGFVQIGQNVKIHPILFFTVLRHLMKILAMQDKRVEGLRRAISAGHELETYLPSPSWPRPDVQEMGVTPRRQLLALARCLLEDWPQRFIELSQDHKIWSSLWLRHFESSARSRGLKAPFWFWSVVQDHLYRARYRPSLQEMTFAVEHLKQLGERLNKSTLSRLLGVAVIRRGPAVK